MSRIIATPKVRSVIKIEPTIVSTTEVYWETPRLTRCLFCLPIRQGLLACGYINLIYTLSVLVYLVYTSFLGSARGVVFFRAALISAEPFVLVVLCLVDAALLLSMLIGVHKKRMLCLKIYMVYCAASTIAALLLDMSIATQFSAVKTILVIFGTALQIYVLILLRSHVLKVENETVQYIPSQELSHDEEPITCDS